ncbi:MAG: hypothetical protein ACUVS4_00995 [Chloroflexaceae bacterium]
MYRRTLRTSVIVVLALALLATLTAAMPARAQARTRCFPETGYCVSGRILDYWERNGGLAVFGFRSPSNAPRPSKVSGPARSSGSNATV